MPGKKSILQAWEDHGHRHGDQPRVVLSRDVARLPEQPSDFLVDFQDGSLRAQVNLAHTFTGVVAIGLSVYVTGKWTLSRFRVDESCYSKNLTRATIGAWIIALGFGILVYLAHVLEWM